MIPQTTPKVQPKAWQVAMREAIRSPQELLQLLQLDDVPLANDDIQTQFPILVPREFASRMRPKDYNDPLLRQVLPVQHEDEFHPDFLTDPLHEVDSLQTPGLLHKYHGRALLTVTGTCAINCRYCFRRHFPYADNVLSHQRLQAVRDYLSADSSIHEIILSGGDPLLVSDQKLQTILTTLEAIAHVTSIRIHSRLPIVLPARIDADFCELFKKTSLRKVMVVHANHPNELNEQVLQACQRLKDAGFLIFNQAVLLRGVNDTPEILEQLCLRCCDLGIVPYYLHRLDKVQHAQHFDIPLSQIQQLYEQLRQRLPGYALPKLVQEIPGERHKTPISK